MSTVKKFGVAVRRLGGRTVTGMATALVASLLICAAPEVGLLGAIGGVVVGGISAVLMRPHALV